MNVCTSHRRFWFHFCVMIVLAICVFYAIRSASFSKLITKACSHSLELKPFLFTSPTLQNCNECIFRDHNNRFHESLDFKLPNDPMNMTGQQIFEYIQWTNSSSCRIAVDFGVVYKHRGIPDGHKAVCLDPHIGPVYNECLVYSFGISHQWSFDEAMANYKCQVFSFDPSMGIQDFNRSDFIHFFNLGLADTNKIEERQLSTGNDTRKAYWRMMKASSIYDMLKAWHGERVIDVLKMDIEFAEWPILREMLHSGFLASKIKQLAVEIHLDDEINEFQEHVQLLRKLESPLKGSGDESIGGFARFSSRLNPYTKQPFDVLDGKEEYAAYELAWYNMRFL